MFILPFIILLFKYTIFYCFLYLLGKSLIKLLSKKFVLDSNKSNILGTRIDYLYPLLGLIFLGNLLILLNTFFPIKGPFIFSIFVLLTIPALKGLDISLKKSVNFDFIFSFVVIPIILVISTYDITFNYDAGYYHLLHQNWIRESNMIVGMVNIFFALGMSSIYEYISAFLWFDETMVFVHFLNIYFVHFFFLFIKENLINKRYQSLYNVSLVILIYSILDNFGFGGGRNGFIYIQGVTKQDTTVGILFWVLTIVMLHKISKSEISRLEILALSLITFFVYQVKVSGVMIIFVYAYLIINLLIKKKYKLSTMLYLHIPAFALIAIWFSKSIFTTGCFIYPVDVTCIENFNWYVKGSTANVEYYTKLASKNYDMSIPFTEWIQKVAKDTFEYRGQVLKNFLISSSIIFGIKLAFFEKLKNQLLLKIFMALFVIINFTYLLFYGPIPRYAIGICMVSVSMIGYFSGDFKFKLTNGIKYALIFVSVFSVVRLNSYISFIENDDLRIFNPLEVELLYEDVAYVDTYENWVKPKIGDQCWANLKCTMSDEDIYFTENSLFKTAYRQ